MQLHRAQYAKVATVSHLPGLFQKESKMNWGARRKYITHNPDKDVKLHHFSIDGAEVILFVNHSLAFAGVPKDEGYKPIDPEVAQELLQSFRAEKNMTGAENDQGETQREIQSLLEQRPNLAGRALASNTRRLRNLAKKAGVELPEGI